LINIDLFSSLDHHQLLVKKYRGPKLWRYKIGEPNL